MGKTTILLRRLVLAAGAVLVLVATGAPTIGRTDVRPVGEGASRTETPVGHAARVERRAQGSSFPALRAFGEAAIRRTDDEGLSRLQHVVFITINQQEFEEAERWNLALRQAAERRRDARYLAISRVNALQIRHFRDGDVSLTEMKSLADAQTDWLPRVVAQTALARMLIDEQRIGDAIRLMAQTLPLIPKNEAKTASVAASAWDRVSIAHMMVDDVPGYLNAIDKAEAYMAASDYPWPQYESVYNLAQSLGFLGRYEESRTLIDVYARLAKRTDTPLARAYAGNLCAYDATARDDWPAVLRCLAPFGRDLDAPEVIADIMLPLRAAAYARTGQVSLAQQDMAEIRKRIADGRISEGGSVKRAQAETMIAAGDYDRGVAALRDYHLSRFLRASRSAAAAMEQVVVGIDEQLQVATAQNALKARVINTQLVLVGVLIALGAGLAVLLSKQRRLSRQLAAANEREREIHEAKSAFFSNMSHEIRTPLNGVIAMADALGRADLDDEAKHMVRIIASSGAALERLLSDILDDAKMEAGQIEIEKGAFDLIETVSDVQTLWIQKAHEKGVRIETRLDTHVTRWALGDRIRLSQVLNNLVSNALKFTSAGEVVLSVDAKGPDRVRFAVTDTGVGFDALQKERIFERFQQADSTITRRFGGTGLGLSICRQLVGLMGGRLECDSTPGEGSRFWFEIELPPADPAEDRRTPPPEASPDSTRLRILAVDDHPANRTILGVLLKADDIDLHFAEDGQAALEVVQAQAFDVILMDMKMPVMDGHESTRAIRAFEARNDRRRSTIIILSANTGAEDQQRGREAGADGHIAKPIVLERLIEGIELARARNRG